MTVSMPVVAGEYPVVLVGSPLKPQPITSVVAMPLPDEVTTVAHAPELIADVPRAAVPLATVCDTVAVPLGNVNVVLPVPPLVVARVADSPAAVPVVF